MADLVCLSHLPWALELERPHQLMRRLARSRRVFFVEDPLASDRASVRVEVRRVLPKVHVCSIRVPADADPADIARERRGAVMALASSMRIRDPILWVYAPGSVGAARDLAPSLLVYDCIDEHAARRHAPLDARAREADLLAHADVVFAAGDALFEVKRGRNVSTYPVPSAVDVEHFATARRTIGAGARVGFLGTIDDRVDLDLVAALATRHPDVRFDLVGALADVTPEELPKRRNIRWLGGRSYAELPAIVGGWSLAIVPWRIDDATLRVEPVGILPCLAARVPVLAPPLPAVVERYAGVGAVTIADPAWFADAVGVALGAPRFDDAAVDPLLARTSWDGVAKAMARLVDEAAMGRALASRWRRACPA